MKIFKNKFLIIMLLSVITLVALVLGGMTLYKEEALVFSSDGYIIESGAEVNKKYYFSANTKYKENVEDKIVFDDVDNKQVKVNPASFVHYSNGDVTFLKKGALVNLTELNSSMVNYYNITNESTIKYENNSYVVSVNDKKINIESFLGRISDNKYLITGKDLKLKIPQNSELISGEYFEVLFIEDGIVKIDNEKASYQVTAQDTYVYIGANITINLGNGKIVYEDDVKMLMSQITISGDENIDLDVDDKNNSSSGGSGGSGSSGEEDDNFGLGEDGEGIGDGTGEGTGDGTGEGTGDGTGEGTGDGTGEGEGTGENEGEGTGDGTGDGSGSEGENGSGNAVEGVDVTASLQVELIEAVVTSTTIDLSLQLNNATLVKGKLLYYFTNLATGKREGNSEYIDLVNGTFEVSQESLSPSTDYSFTIVETDGKSEKHYFQKTFTTKDLGITLEKIFATDSSLAYKVNFGENSDVSKARVSICEEVTDKDGNVTCGEFDGNKIEVSKDEIGKEIIFGETNKLKSNTTYAVSIDMVWIDKAAYSGVYTINRLDTTLKKTPSISGIKVDANAEEVRFDIKLSTVSDPDKSIEKYIYKIYLASDITEDNLEPIPQYVVAKNDSDDLVLNLNEINELKTGVDYRCRIYAQYNDNEMVREIATPAYSSNFLIKSKPKIEFKEETVTMNKVTGTLKLLDANCAVPFQGRTCANRSNTFTLRYYKSTEDEHTNNDRTIKFDNTLTTELEFSDLESNTTYVVKLFGGYYDDNDKFLEGLQIGDAFLIKTDKSDNIYFEAFDNISGQNKDGSENIDNVVTIDARLTAPKESTIMDEISTITFNLYNGRYNKEENLLGTYVITEKSDILAIFNNKTITNSLFTDVTGMNVGKINTLQKLIRVTNKFKPIDNLNQTLNNAYTIEVTDVFDSTGKNEIKVENPVYTFYLTNSYYLDSRIASNPKENYLTVTPITKGSLTEEEHDELSKDVKNLDSLNKDTVVGLIIENSLSDIFVDSAYTYEKVMVNYTIYNSTTNKSVKTISVDMGNKYQPKEQIVYLDSSDFVRGYKYRVGFNIDFITKDGTNPNYTNDKLYKTISIEKQAPSYTQYIYSSNDEGITYKYKFTDVDSVISDNNFYYTLGKDSKEYKSIKNSLKVDSDYHEVTIPISKNSEYALYYLTKNTDNKETYIAISNYNFEKEYKYDKSVSYSIVDDNSNILKLKLENNDYNSRAYAYRVTITADGIEPYTRYFLASKLGVLTDETGVIDADGKEQVEEHKYIGIDFANIIDFMGSDMNIEVFCYYDSGLVGVNQKFSHGLILKNSSSNKFLNTYYQGKDYKPTSSEDLSAMGIYHLRNAFSHGNTNMFIYNHLVYDPDTVNYNNITGIEKESNLNLDYYGIDYGVDYTHEGIVLINGKNKYTGYNFRVLNGVTFSTDDNSFKFDAIIPSIKVVPDNTINSIRLNIIPSGIYGNKQFIKDDKVDNKIYVQFYSDKEMTNKLGEPIEREVTIGDNGATIEQVVFENLKPATTYYYTVSAYINNIDTRLFDSDILAKNKKYSYVDYNTSTLDVSGLLDGLMFSVSPTAYKGEYAENTLSWRLNLKNTDNYRIRFELYMPDGTTTVVNPETNEEEVVKKYKAVKFNGDVADSCNINSYGTSGAGYVSGCYINVNKDDVSNINKRENIYKFTNKDFVFGGNYYKLLVYAVPYTNESYVEDDRLLLYQNDSLSTTGNLNVGGISYNIKIPKLEEASFSLENSLVTGISGNNYYISFVPKVTDTYKVMKNGSYVITVKDDNGNVIKKFENIERDTTIGKKFTVDNLRANSLYYIELSYSSYRNNVGFSEEDKTSSTPFTTFIYTPVNNDITLGSITARQITGKSITLSYNGSSHLADKIFEVWYTITVNGSNSKVNGKYILDYNKDSIFTTSTDNIPRLTIDVSVEDPTFTLSDNPKFTFKEGNTYIISTQYYYYEEDKDGNKVRKRLEDLDGKFTYTTILNL